MIAAGMIHHINHNEGMSTEHYNVSELAYFLLVNVKVLVESVRHYKRSRLSAAMEDGKGDHLNVDSYLQDSYNHWNPKILNKTLGLELHYRF